MSHEKESVLTKGSQNNVVNDVFTRELFDSTSTGSSINGSTTSISTGGFSSLECCSNDLQVSSGLSSPRILALTCAEYSCKFEPPLKLQHADINLLPPLKLQYADSKISPPLKLQSTNSNPSSSPSALRYPRKVEHDNETVKRSMGLMKLRRQGSRSPASRSSNKSSCCHGSFNQAAAARELMASLERLSMKEKTIDTNEKIEREAQRALLGGAREKSVIAAAASSRNGMQAAELPLTAKIAAAMDAEGLIGVQEEISLQCSKYKSTRVVRSFNDLQYYYSPPPNSFNTCCKSRRKPRSGAAASGDHEMQRPAASTLQHSALSKRRSRWIILRRLRSSRALLGKIWRKFKRVFSSSTRKLQQKELLKVNI